MSTVHLESNDYFEVLAISRSASHDDVKKAYRKLAILWHPDKNRHNPQAEEYFKKIAEAYEVLSNPKKREMYEKYGKQQSESSRNYENQDPFGFHRHAGHADFSARHARDIFEAFFGQEQDFHDFFGSSSSRHGPHGPRGPHRFMDSFFSSGFDSNESSPFGFGTRHAMNSTSNFMTSSSMSNSSMSSFGGTFGAGRTGFSQNSSTSTYTDRNGRVMTTKTITTRDSHGETKTVTEEYENGQLIRSDTKVSNRLTDAPSTRMQVEDEYKSSQKPRRSSRSRV